MLSVIVHVVYSFELHSVLLLLYVAADCFVLSKGFSGCTLRV